MGKNKEPIKKGYAKVPAVMQMEALECGAACLTMVLAYYGKWLPLEQVRVECGVSRDGSSAKNIVKAAINYGLSPRAFRTEPEVLKKDGSFPCIIHWEFNHFVVLCGFRGEKAVLNDPAKGTYLADPAEFDRGFTGICLEFTPGEAFERTGKPKSTISFAKKRLHGAGATVLFVVLTTLAVSLLHILSLGFSRVFLDMLVGGNNSDFLVPFVLAAGGAGLLQCVALCLREIQSYRICGKLAAAGSISFMQQIFRMPMEFFSQRMAGDIQLRAASNTEIAKVLINTFAPLILDAAMMILYLVIMLSYSAPLALIGVVSVLINLWLCTYISKKRVNITRVMLRDEGKLAGTTVSGIEMIDSIKASGAENGFFERWAGYQASANAGEAEYTNVSLGLGAVPALISAVTEILILALGVYLVIKGSFTAGMLLAFQGLLTAFASPARQLIAAGQTLQEMRSDMERIEDVMEYPEDVVFRAAATETEEHDKLSGAVEIRNVTFGYGRLAEPLIRDFNLKLSPGKRVAIVGTSGCGKSTVAKLISGLYAPWSGEILFDGKPLSEINRAVFTGSVAVVDQDVILFEDTIANNIKMWDSTIEDFEMILAARDAQLHDDIMQRNGGYNYRIAEGGKDFSGGQKQRLEIARVLAQDPTILIMDEATSALDARTEYDVVESITARGITCIVIAHRLSTVRDADEILVMDNGVVVERGTHEELFVRGGVYTQLISSE